MLTKNRIRITLEQEKERVIDYLIQNGIHKLDDGRQLYEATLTELQQEQKHVELVRRGYTFNVTRTTENC